MAERHVYSMMVGPDTVIAESEEHAWEVWAEHCGEDPADYSESDGWELLPDRKRLAVGHDDLGDIERQLRGAEQHGLDIQQAIVVVKVRGLDWLAGEAHFHPERGRYAIDARCEWWAGLPCGHLCSTEW